MKLSWSFSGQGKSRSIHSVGNSTNQKPISFHEGKNNLTTMSSRRGKNV